MAGALKAAGFDETYQIPDWDESVGARAFRFDAFLSHNRFDDSEELSRTLRRYGAKIWHDSEVDLHDRMIVSRVSIGILTSRFVVVNIPTSFRYTSWMQAELGPSLELERTRGLSHGLRRVLVFTKSMEIQIPNELSECLRFTDARKLAEFIIDSNKIEFHPAAVSSQLGINTSSFRQHLDAAKKRWIRRFSKKNYSLEADLSQIKKRLKILSLKDRLLFQIERPYPATIDELDSQEFSERCLIYRNYFCDNPRDLPRRSSLAGRMLRAHCALLSLSPNIDNRANAILMLAAIDERWQCNSTRDDVVDVLRKEEVGAVMGLVVPWLCHNFNRLTPRQLKVVELSALRAPDQFRRTEAHPLIKRLCSAVRCRILVEHPLGRLTRNELMKLIYERLEWVFDDRKASLTSVGAEIELLCRELCVEVLDFRPGSEALSDELEKSSELRESLVAFLDLIVRRQII